MSVWRIDKVDAQTRALAEAAAKAAGLPLGVWLERAIMRRVENRAASAMPPLPPLPAVESPAAGEPAPEISPEMKAALDAAERRRHRPPAPERKGEDAVSSPDPVPPIDLADPFAAPEQESEEKPFEQPVTATATDSAAMLKLDDDVPVIDPEEYVPDDSLFAGGAKDEDEMPARVDERANADPAADIATALAAMDPSPSPEPFLEPGPITTTTRQSVMAAEPAIATSRNSYSSLVLIAVGVVVIVLAGGAGGYFLLRGPAGKPSDAEAAAQASAPAAPAKPAQQAAASPAPSAARPEPTAAAPTTAPSPGADTGTAAASPAASAQESTAAPPAAANDVAPPSRPSIVNMSMLEMLAPPPPGSAQPAPTVAGPAESKPAAASEALPALRNRAEAGDLDAQLELGRRYIDGVGVGRNPAEAAKWLQRAADQGNAQAQFNVGVMYERGVGVDLNMPRAIEYYRKAAAQSTPMALHNLALIYTGEQSGIKADLPQARRLMTQAAELGLPESQYSLALMHLQGVGGPADRAMALSWLAVAARPNMTQLIELARQLSAQLTDAERQRARQLAEDHVRRIQANVRKLQAASTTQTATIQPTAPDKPRVIDRAAIMEMQKLLAGLKIYNGTADGTMGPRTIAAIKEFQAMAGMTVDGKPSFELLENLREVSGLTTQ